jgi:hypothetical protein
VTPNPPLQPTAAAEQLVQLDQFEFRPRRLSGRTLDSARIREYGGRDAQ